jgi:transposase
VVSVRRGRALETFEEGRLYDRVLWIDWAEARHDVALVNENGHRLGRCRIPDTVEGLVVLLALLAEHGDSPDDPIPVAIETGRGLLVACLVATGRDVVVISPMATARYRERTAVTRTKSDAADALMLANVLRTDRHAHRSLPNDSELVRAVAVLARAG